MTTVRVFAYIFGALWVLCTLVCLLFGVGMLVGGVGASSSRSSTEALSDLLGGLGAVFGALGAVLIGVAVVCGLFAWFCFWAGGALGRGSAVARVLFTVVAGLYVCLELFSVVSAVAVARIDGGATLAVNLVLMVVPILLIVLLWGPESARRHFTPVAPPPAPWGSIPYAIPAPTPAPTNLWPLDASTDRLRPDRAPNPRCRRCGTETERHWAHCGHCGDRLPAVGV